MQHIGINLRNIKTCGFVGNASDFMGAPKIREFFLIRKK